MIDPPRPTIRCVFEDLADTVEDARQRSALQAGQLPDLAVRLHDLDHPIVAAARERYAEGKPRARDWYRSVRDHPWVECRHGERWRGLVLWHPGEQRWLCFAGWHESDSHADVYEQFTRRCTTGSTVDSSRFLPEPLDEIRLEGEQHHLRAVEARRRFKRDVLGCLVAAATSPGDTSTTRLPDGSTLRATLRVDGDIDELTLQIAIDWRGGQGAATVEDVKDAVPGIATNEWDILPPGPADLDPVFLVYVDTEWAANLVEAATTYGLDVLGSDPNLVLDPADGAAHVIPDRSKTSAAYVEGQPVRALCGRRFVPTSDPEAAEPCRECSDARKRIERRRSRE